MEVKNKMKLKISNNHKQQNNHKQYILNKVQLLTINIDIIDMK